MKYKLWQIFKLILVGVLPVFFSLGGVFMIAPLSYPTYEASGEILAAALMALGHFAYPMAVLFIIENVWCAMGGVMKSNEFRSPLLAVFLALIIPTALCVWGLFYNGAASGSIIFKAFSLVADGTALLLGLKMYPGLMPFGGYLAFLLVLAVVFLLGYVGAPIKSIFKTWYICSISPCFYNALMSAQGNFSPEMAMGPQDGAVIILVFACRIAWPFLFLAMIREAWYAAHPGKSRRWRFMPQNPIKVHRGL